MTPRTPLALTRLAAEHMAERGIENARLEAELLLASVLGTSRLDLYLQHDRPLTGDETAAFRVMIRRRLQREPLQYILGEAHFRELILHVDARVLIPRPETEVLVGEVLGWAGARTKAREGGTTIEVGASPAPPGNVSPSPSPSLTALDIGTGSGAIALSLAREGPFDKVVATDISAGALGVAEQNAERNGVAGRVEFRAGALWDACGEDERFDVVASNPPYIAERERPALAPEVRDWEPAAALFAPEHGLAVIAALIDGAAARLRPGGLLAIEVAPDQAAAAAERIVAAGSYAAPRVVCDLAGRDRVVLATSNSLAR